VLISYVTIQFSKYFGFSCVQLFNFKLKDTNSSAAVLCNTYYINIFFSNKYFVITCICKIMHVHNL